MQKFQDVIVRNSGSDKGVVPVEGASVLVQSFPGAVNSALYSDDGITPKTNPLTTDSEGRFSFYAADGRYQLVISGTLIANQTITDVLLEDPEDGSVGVFSDLTATNSLTLSAMTAGSILFAGVGGLVSQDNANLSFNDATNALSVGGQILTANGTISAPSIAFTADPNTGIYWGASSGRIGFTSAGQERFGVSSGGPRIPSASTLAWSSTTSSFGASDLLLGRDAANVLAQVNSTNPQAFRSYNTFTDSSNYERANARWQSNTFQLVTESSGTGVARGLDVGTLGSGSLGLVANNSRFWILNSSGHFITNNDNSSDFGASGSNRPRTAYLGTSIQIGANPSTAGAINLANAANISARNAANSADVQMIRLSSSDNVLLSPAGGADIQWGKALVALGGGSVPTLGTIGGTGPATAAQNTWMRVIDSTGAAFWVPAWK